MKVRLINYIDDMSDELPVFGVWWSYFNGNPEMLVRSNAHRERIGFPKVLDEGSCAYCHLNFGKRRVGIEVQIRPRVLEERT